MVTEIKHDLTGCYAIKLASRSGGKGFISHCRAADDRYEVGDLVSFWNSGLKDQEGNPIGLLIARLLPEVHRVHGWKLASSR
jgi:hypothetical protein